MNQQNTGALVIIVCMVSLKQVPLDYPELATALRGVGVGFVGTALSAASISSPIDHTGSAMPSAIAGG